MSHAHRLKAALAAMADGPVSRDTLASTLGVTQRNLRDLARKWLCVGYVALDDAGKLTLGPRVLIERIDHAARIARRLGRRRKDGSPRRLNGGFPKRLGPILLELADSGPITFEALVGRFPYAAGGTSRPQYVNRWVKRGWLVRLAGGKIAPGPLARLALDERAPRPAPARKPRRRVDVVDVSSIEGTDQWLVLAQLEHGPLRERDIAVDVLDRSQTYTNRLMLDLEQLGLVRKQRHGQPWELVRRQEAAE